MSVIRLLDKHVAELIAAGEVVDRPASVVKELVENSIDAGATKITVEIKNGGISYIRVTDNGCGIAREDVEIAFLRHATSKIKDKNDLDSIGTLGFRGEALASISAVAKVNLITKTVDCEIGTSFSVFGGEAYQTEDAGCPNGTTIVVKDLFYNTPARMKFLKKDMTEAIAVAGILDKIAVSHPEISFSFIKDGQEMFYTDGDSDWLNCIRSVCGKEFSDSLIKVDYVYDNFKVTGYICKPLAARKNRSKQFFYINKRFVKSVTMMSALEEAYKNVIMSGKFPSCVLNIDLPHDFVDVNVHPSKTEVRFSNEKPVFYTVFYGAKSALENKDNSLLSNIDKSNGFKSYYSVDEYVQPTKFFDKSFTDNSVKEVPVFNDNVRIPKKLSFGANSPFLSKKVDDFSDKEVFKSTSVDSFVNSDSKNEQSIDSNIVTHFDYNYIGEIFNTYIICQLKDEVVFIDKHAAHERIIYNSLSKDNDGHQQMLLDPIVVTLSKDDYSAILNNLDIVDKSGFVVEDFGMSKIIIRAVPTYIKSNEAEELLEEIAEHFIKNPTSVISEKLDWIYHSIACRAAVKGGNLTSEIDDKNLVETLLNNQDIQYCPHGRPILFRLSKREIEKRFGRLQ